MKDVIPENVTFSLRGKLGDRVYGITHGTQWSRAHFIPPDPKTEPQQNNRHAFRLINLLFAAEPTHFLRPWINRSNELILPKANVFVKRGMNEYIEQLGVEVYATDVTVVGQYPDEEWTWENK